METDHQSSNILLTNRCEYSYKDERCAKPVTQNSHFCTEHTNQPSVDLAVYKSIHTRFQHYVNVCWTRTNFFFLVQAGLFTVFTGVLASTVNQSSRYLIPIDFIIGFVGLFQAFIWHRSARVQHKFMKLWRIQLIKIDKEIDKRQHHTEVEEQLLATKFTGIEPIILLSLTFIIGWSALLGTLLWLTLRR